MSDPMNINLRHIARGMAIPLKQIQAVVQLFDEGNTVPFITRYRKDETGGMDEVQIRQILAKLTKMRQLLERKQTILRSIESQGKLTPDLERKIKAATTAKRLEDLYLPFKQNKQTLAAAARKRGLEPLALEILENRCADLRGRAAEFVHAENELPTVEEVLTGAGHILAESYSENPELRQKLREEYLRSARIVTSKLEVKAAEPVVEETPAEPPAAEAVAETATETATETTAEEAPAGDAVPADTTEKTTKEKAKPRKSLKKQKSEEKKQKAFQDYYHFEESVRKIPPHRVLAINRGEHAKVIRVKVEVDNDALQKCAETVLHLEENANAAFLKGCVRDALSRLIVPALERETRRELTENAETHAVDVFAKNLRNLLLQSPIHDHRVLAVDPGFKNGCKLAAIDQFGNFLEHGIIYLVGKSERIEEAKQIVLKIIEKYHLTLIAIGNGTACRTAEDFFTGLLSNELAGQDVSYVIANEAGASVYSTSVLGREEFPEYDATLRGAISIGRRVQDPLSEMVKIDPANIGVGLYQHDVKAKHLRESLEGVVESCVNFVGVDVNTASPALLRFVSGLNQLSARKIYEYRRQNGPFKNREQLKNVPNIGEATFVQAAGFLKIAKGDNPLDTTWIHPESYALAAKILEKIGVEVTELRHVSKDLEAKINALDTSELAAELQTGELKLKDILAQLVRPGRDPREDLPKPIFKKGVMKLEDLTPGMELTGTILNVVDFGAFVDIGLHESGLVHVSQIADRYIRDPHDMIAVGDVVRAWVVGVDKDRRRISLTMIDPAKAVEPPAEKPVRRRHRRGKKSGGAESATVPTPTVEPGVEVAAVISPKWNVGLRLVSEAPADFVPRSEREKQERKPRREERSERSERSERRPSEGKSEKPPREDRREERRPRRSELARYQYRKETPKVEPVLTDEMKKGKAPMRGFDELAAFFKDQ
ncbi:MAG: Tex family protein [Planctomycetia bacterium]|nr:Tex family protein [Planctomycetia bacterium]